VDVFVENGRIERVVPHDPDLAPGDAHQRVDCRELTVTPGLVDAHGHVTALGLGERGLARMNSDEVMVYVEKALYTTLIDGGVTTLRDIGGATHKMKRLVDEGVMLGPRLKIAICMLSTTGGHADFRGPDRCHAQLNKIWPEAPGRPSSIVDGPWECRKRVREIAACGADLIKVCTSPGVASPSDHLEHREFTSEELRAITDEATARGLTVAAHAHSVSGIEMAIECGVHDIQHISYMNERLVERADHHGCVVTPTAWVGRRMMEDISSFSPFVQEKIKKMADHHEAAITFAAKGGLRILAGIDPVLTDMHGQNYMELVELARLGVPVLSAWWGATGLAAREIGQEDAGTIEAGQRADLLVCRDDVVTSPSAWNRSTIVEVFKDGDAHRGAFSGVPVRRFSDTVRAVLTES
jgi:imidazolonepropionase-like amidohydrolase